MTLTSKLWLVVLLLSCHFCLAQDNSGKKYLLQYKMQAGETIVTRVEHFAETRTTMAEHDESSRSQTTSQKVWEITAVDAEGNMTFDYRIDSVRLSQSIGDSEPQIYDSSKDSEVPDMFRPVAETVGKTLATISINQQGQVLNRDKELQTPQLGMGDLTIPLPNYAIAVGERWSVPREMRVKLENGEYKKIKVRELYTLDKVATGVATIRIVTQPLTPVNDPAVEAQLIQQLSKGEIRFDMDRGRLLSKRLDWSEEVVGFRGPDTSLRYDGKFIEELQDMQRTASRP
ncbi:MAG: hypothetical protein NXI32_17470 [bacterium]|nr:hypothetical protein [bacterium]